MPLDTLHYVARKLLKRLDAAPPIERGRAPVVWFYSTTSDLPELRRRLQNVLPALPRHKLVTDPPDTIRRALGRRTGWRRLEHSLKPGDVVLIVDPMSLGPVWIRRRDKTLPRLNRLGRRRVRIHVLMAERPDVELTGMPSVAELERVRRAGRIAYNRLRTREALAELKAVGSWYGRPPFSWGVRNGKLVPHPDDLEVVRELCRRHEGGETLISILRDFQGRGVTLADGSNWNVRRVGAAFRYGCRFWNLGTRKRRPWDFKLRRTALRA